MPAENNLLWTDAEVQNIIQVARTWNGVRFRHQGRSRSGVDCVGLFSCIGTEVGRPDPIPNNYSHNPDTRLLMTEMKKRFDEVLIKDMLPGDLLMMRFENAFGKASNQHIALRTDCGIIHAAAMYRKVCEHSLTPEWFNRIEHVFRFKRVAA